VHFKAGRLCNTVESPTGANLAALRKNEGLMSQLEVTSELGLSITKHTHQVIIKKKSEPDVDEPPKKRRKKPCCSYCRENGFGECDDHNKTTCQNMPLYNPILHQLQKERERRVEHRSHFMSVIVEEQ